MKPLFLLFVLLSFNAFAQDAASVLKKMQASYSSREEFELSMTYELFKGHKSNKVEESYTGIYQKSREGYYQKMDELEYVATKDYFLAISHDEGIMLLENAKKMEISDLDFEALLKRSASLELKTEEKNYVVLIWFPADAREFSLVKITLDKKEFELKKLDLYYATSTDFSKGITQPDYEQPHLRISYGDLSEKIKKDAGRYQLKTYLSAGKGDGLYKGYELIDKRIKK